ncbi:unnamed protein product [Closterium sp. NIES-65]|nr:unnamed protein product [Closterium sp. NIES-65]
MSSSPSLPLLRYLPYLPLVASLHPHILHHALLFPVASCFLPTTPCFLPTTPCFLPTTPCFLPTTPCFLPTTPCFLPTTPFFLTAVTGVYSGAAVEEGVRPLPGLLSMFCTLTQALIPFPLSRCQSPSRSAVVVELTCELQGNWEAPPIPQVIADEPLNSATCLISPVAAAEAPAL